MQFTAFALSLLTGLLGAFLYFAQAVWAQYKLDVVAFVGIALSLLFATKLDRLLILVSVALAVAVAVKDAVAILESSPKGSGPEPPAS